jgi:hypothetical protein
MNNNDDQETKSARTPTIEDLTDTDTSTELTNNEVSTESDKQFDKGTGIGKPIRRKFRAKLTND